MKCCEGCYFNRPMMDRGETFQACFYGLEREGKLHGLDECSGYEPPEMQLKLNLGEA